MQLRIERWLGRHVAQLLEPLVKLADDEEIKGLARGLAFRLVEHLGVIARDEVADDVKALPQEERAALRKHGVRFGAFHLFIPALLKPAPTELRLLLWAIELERTGQLERSRLPESPGQGLVSVPFDRSTPKGFYRVVGFRICGQRVRAHRHARAPRRSHPRPCLLETAHRGGGPSVRLGRGRRLRRRARHDVASSAARARSSHPSCVPWVSACSAARDPPRLRRQLPRPSFLPLPKSLRLPLKRAAPSDQPDGEAPAEEAVAAEATEPSPPLDAAPKLEPGLVGEPSAAPVVAAGIGEEPAASGEPGMIEVWWPRDTGPFRRQHQPRSHGPKDRTAAKDRPAASDRNAKDRPAKHRRKPTEARQASPQRPPRREPQPNPDSPFAILGELKAQLAAKKNG